MNSLFKQKYNCLFDSNEEFELEKEIILSIINHQFLNNEIGEVISFLDSLPLLYQDNKKELVIKFIDELLLKLKDSKKKKK
jgi:hypothetical protein